MKLSSKLREYTKHPHQQLEKLLISRLKSISTTDDYVSILKSFYGFIMPLENEIGKQLDESILPDYPERRKSAALLADLKYLDSDLKIEISDDAPLTEDKYQAIGALYVLEGSTLGGQIISKMIGQVLNLSQAGGLSYFTAYGQETAPMWDKFKKVLDSQSLDRASEDKVIKSAEQTFIKFSNWLL